MVTVCKNGNRFCFDFLKPGVKNGVAETEGMSTGITLSKLITCTRVRRHTAYDVMQMQFTCSMCSCFTNWFSYPNLQCFVSAEVSISFNITELSFSVLSLLRTIISLLFQPCSQELHAVYMISCSLSN